MNIKLMTFNIMSGKSYKAVCDGNFNTESELIDIKLTADIISKHSPDIICLNEVHNKGYIYNDQTEYLAKKCGYKYYYFASAIEPKGSPYGNAIMSRYPIIEAKKILIISPVPEMEHSETRCIIKATVDLGKTKICVLCTHLGLLHEERVKAIDKIKDIAEHISLPCVLMGDLNSTPNSQYIEALDNIFSDTLPDKEEKLCSFIGKENPHLKIDYIFAGKEFKVLDSYVADSTSSDHYPCISEIKI